MLVIGAYDRERARAYAERWAFDRNPLFTDFSGIGGNCTNFVSQCVYAGSCRMNFTPVFGWYYLDADDRAPAFTGVEYFWDFFTGAPAFAAVNGGIGPFGREVGADAVVPGDVVQLGDAAGDYYHTLLITDLRAGEAFVTAHSNDVLNRPLSSYGAPLKRYLHIDGVRLEIADDTCFEGLYMGTRLPPV
jgi:hypothetical protein